MNRDLEEEINPDEVEIDIDDSGTKLAPVNSAIGMAHKKKTGYAINDEVESEADFEMGGAEMFDQAEYNSSKKIGAVGES